MNGEPHIFDLIEKYHLGLLSKEERNSVEERMQSDASFAEYVKINGLTNQLVNTVGLDLLREQMTSDLSRLDKARKIKRWTIGTGIIGLLLLLATLVYFTQYPAKRKLPQSSNVKKSSSIKPVIKESAAVNTSSIKKSNATTISTSQEKKSSLLSKKDPETLTITDDSIVLYAQPVKEEVQVSKDINSDEKNSIKCDLAFRTIVNPACRGESNGSIELDKESLKGGTMPYRFVLFSLGKESSNGIFSGLPNGKYLITMYDAKSCIYSKEVLLPEKDCIKRRSESFNPDVENWKVATQEGESGSFTIYNRSGIVIFKDNFTAQNSTEWQGINTQGMPVEAGLYVCIVEYIDGKKEIIDISIVR